MRRPGLTLTALLLSASLFAAPPQKATITGVVEERSTVRISDYSVAQPLPYAVVSVKNGADSTAAVANSEGRFTIKNLEPGKVFMKVSMLGYEEFADSLVIDPGQNTMIFSLKLKEEQLKGAKVTADIPVLRQIKDTLVYNPLVVDTKEGDKAIEILKQLPGFEIDDNGGVKVFGEKISRTYVNGKLIFGDDILTSANVLLASDVKDVRVYEETTEQAKERGLVNSRKRRVMDIRTHKEIDHALDFTASGTIGADTERKEDGRLNPRYAAGMNLGYYSEKFVVSTDVSANNMSKPASSAKMMFNSPASPMEENRNDVTASVKMNKYWGDRSYGNKIDFNYSYGRRTAKSGRHSMTDYFETASSPARHYEDTTTSSSLRNSHRFSVNLDLKKTPLKSIKYSIVSSLDENRSNNANSIMEIGSAALRSQKESNYSDDRNWGINQYLNWSSDESILGIFPSLSVIYAVNNSDGSGWTLDTLASSFNRRQLESNSIGRSHNFRAELKGSTLLSNNEKSTTSLKFGYFFNKDYFRKVKTSWQLFGVEIPELYQGGTFDYTYNNVNHGPDAEFNIHTPNSDIAIGSQFSFYNVADDENVPVAGGLKERVKGNWFVPEPYLTYRNRKDYTFTLYTTSGIPYTEQIRPRIDDSNPLSIRGGNPNLKPSTRLSACFGFSGKKMERQLFWFGSLSFSSNLNPIVQKSVYFWNQTVLPEWDGYVAPAGATLFTYENASPSFSINPNITLLKHIKFWKMLFHLTSNIIYESSTQYLGEEAVRLHELSPSAMSQLNGSPTQWFRFSITANLSYRNSRNSNGDVISSRLNPYFAFKPTFTIAKYGYLSASYVSNWYIFLNGNIKNYRNDFMNLYFGYKFLKGNLDVRLTANDILNSGSSYTTSTSADSYTQNWAPCFGRYIAIGICFNLTKTNGSANFKNDIQRNQGIISVSALPR